MKISDVSMVGLAQACPNISYTYAFCNSYYANWTIHIQLNL